jgi:hypothetical protein
MSASNSSCVVLVPVFSAISPRCEDALRELERRGYPVRRVRGFSAIDQGRNQMASEALHDGFAETMWIDPDIGFSADGVDRLRSHTLPLVAGIYPEPRGRSLACHLLPDTSELIFGDGGGLVEIQYAAAGFLHVRREAYESIRDQLKLPLCNTRFGRGLWPFFWPVAVADENQNKAGQRPGDERSTPLHRYLTEDFAFCHRARQAGLKVMADTTIRLWRTGSYGYGWEDAGRDPERFDTFHFQVE